ncbi:MAG: hypothetical protein FWE82_10015, partial [Defluviitaleaceae bacterium]|nr:hypothetical protein [Defluviitaleaceae bacterium]
MDIKNNLKSFGADKMTSKERFARMYEHRDADRVPIMDYPWGVTVDRWVAEGMPDRDFVKYFGLDNVATIHADFSPRYEFKVLEDTPEYTVYTTNWGATMKNWKHIASTPDFLDFKVKDRDSWADAKARMKPGRDRVNWKELEKNYPIWQKEGYWIVGGMWFGFDVAHSWMIGTERFLMALIDDPEWCVDIINTYLDINLAMMDMVWDAGYRFDEINWPDDMGYKGTQFFSLSMYRELIKPAQKRAVEWAQKKGIKTRLHSCGKIDVFIPDF